jgi:hypothetical protein
MTAPKINWRGEIAVRLGLAPDTDPQQLLTALDQALSSRPDGTELIDTEALRQLQAEAELGRTHRERGLVEQAIRLGKIPPSARQSWITLLQTTPGAEQQLASIKPNTLPTQLVGYSKDNDDSSDEALMRELFGTP